MGVFLFTTLKASTIVLNWIRDNRKPAEVMEEGKSNSKSRCAAEFWIPCNSLVMDASSPAKSKLQSSRREMTSGWTRSCIASFVRKYRVLPMVQRASLQDRATAVMLGMQDSLSSRTMPRFLADNEGDAVMSSTGPCEGNLSPGWRGVQFD